jgi:hypothetical protein
MPKGESTKLGLKEKHARVVHGKREKYLACEDIKLKNKYIHGGVMTKVAKFKIKH